MTTPSSSEGFGRATTQTTTQAADPAVDQAQAAARPGLPTRPGQTGGPARRVRPHKKIVRFTLDLEFQQHFFLRSFGLTHGIDGAKVCRALLTRLETDPFFAESILDDVFGLEDDGTDTETA